MTMPSTRPVEGPASRTSSGDAFRAKLRDLDWVRQAGPVELRPAVHALCWRINRATVDGLCADPAVAEKILATAGGVRLELDAHLAATADGEQRTALLRRRTSVDVVIAACRTTVEFHRSRDGRAAVTLAHAIATHRNQLHDNIVRDADIELWQVLDAVEVTVSSTSPGQATAPVSNVDPAAGSSRSVA